MHFIWKDSMHSPCNRLSSTCIFCPQNLFLTKVSKNCMENRKFHLYSVGHSECRQNAQKKLFPVLPGSVKTLSINFGKITPSFYIWTLIELNNAYFFSKLYALVHVFYLIWRTDRTLVRKRRKVPSTTSMYSYLRSALFTAKWERVRVRESERVRVSESESERDLRSGSKN